MAPTTSATGPHRQYQWPRKAISEWLPNLQILKERACARLSFFETTTQVPCHARSTGRLRDQVVDAVIRSGRAVSETAAAFGVSWWTVRAALNEASFLTLPDVRNSARGCKPGPGVASIFLIMPRDNQSS